MTTPLLARAMNLLIEEKEEAIAARQAAEEELNAAVDELRQTRLDLHTALLERAVAQEEAAELTGRTLDETSLRRAVDDLAELHPQPAELSRLVLRALLRRDGNAAQMARELAAVTR